MPAVDRSELDRLERELETLRANRATASDRFESALAEEQDQRERRIAATVRGDSVTSTDQRIGRLRSQQAIESQAIEVLDAAISAKEGEVKQAHLALDRDLATEAEADAAALIAACEARMAEALPAVEADLLLVVEKVSVATKLWTECSKNESGRLFGGTDALDRLRGASKLHYLMQLLEPVRLILGTVPAPERRTPPNPYREREIVIEHEPLERGIVVRTPEQVAARMARFRPVENT